MNLLKVFGESPTAARQIVSGQRPDVPTVSIHGHPRFVYPYFSGFAEERGSDSGRGYNLNFPLPEELTADRYRATLEQTLKRIAHFKPQFLVLALGYDTGQLGDYALYFFSGLWAEAFRSQ